MHSVVLLQARVQVLFGPAEEAEADEQWMTLRSPSRRPRSAQKRSKRREHAVCSRRSQLMLEKEAACKTNGVFTSGGSGLALACVGSLAVRLWLRGGLRT